MNPEILTPTIVLVHGAFEDASIWNKVSGSSTQASRLSLLPIRCWAWQ